MKAARSLLGSATAAGVSFAEVLEPSLIREFEIVYTPMLFVFRPGEDAIACAGRASDPREGRTAAQFGAILHSPPPARPRRCRYTGKYEFAPLVEWVQSQAFGLVTDLRPDNFLQTLSETRPALALFHEPGAAGVDVASAHLAHVAATFADGLDFVKVPRAHYEGLAVRLGVDKTPLSLAILDFGTRLHYAYGGTANGDATNTTADSIAAFVQDYLSGDLSPLPPPPDAVKPAATKADSDGDDEEDTLELPTSLEDVPETVVVANPTADSLMDFWVRRAAPPPPPPPPPPVHRRPLPPC